MLLARRRHAFSVADGTHNHAVIPLALGYRSKICLHYWQLVSDPDRVTTALRSVVTRPLSHGIRCARRLPVTPAAYKQI
jgi:hypothetical protein